MCKAQDLTGKTYGLMTVISRFPSNTDRKIYLLCKCACGAEHIARRDHLLSGKSTSCGCYRDMLNTLLKSTHGSSRLTEYRSWLAMLHRCYNPKVRNYPNYGGRGVTVCDRWRASFENFLADMGFKPEPAYAYSLDRIDPFGHYEPGNCRWADAVTQNNNKRQHHISPGDLQAWTPIDADFEML